MQSLQPLPGQQWYIVSAIQTSEIMGSLDTVKSGIASTVSRIDSNFWLLVALSMLIVGAAALFISNQITRPIKRLTEVANEVSHGKTDVVIDVDSRDEVGELAESFKRMVASLKFLLMDDGNDSNINKSA